MSTFSTRSKLLALLGALLGLVSVGLGVQAAFSKPSLASPTITNKPAAVTTSQSASFSFTGPGGATFKCGLDGATPLTCTSPKTYPDLAEGNHTFSVVAVKGVDQSDPTTYTWAIDRTAPAAPTITAKPNNPSNSTTPSFSFTGGEPGLSFQCKLDGTPFTSCSSPTAYSKLAPGSHSFSVHAVDAAGNTGGANTYAWFIDTTPPAAPNLTVKPDDPTASATSTFEWTGSETDLAYECAKENAAWSSCTTPLTWVLATDNYGQHQLAVRAVDTAGNRSTATEYRFKYEKRPFQITGSVSNLIIGIPQDVTVTVTNPNSVTLYINAITMSIGSQEKVWDDGQGADNCTRDRDLAWTQAVFPPGQRLAVGAGQSVTLPAQGITAPSIELKNLDGTNQDSCKNAAFDLTFSGTATN